MTPAALSRTHAAAFVDDRGWSADEFRELLSRPHVGLFHEHGGFALVSTVAGESELLTLAVHPAHQRQGIAWRLVTQWLASRDADAAFLEVAADNQAAQALYRKHGFAEHGRRKGYYRRAHGISVDAVVMRTTLPHGNTRKTPSLRRKIG